MNALRWIICAAMLVAAGCGTGNGLAGRPGGDQTENGILAKAVDSAGAPLIGARILVRAAESVDSGNQTPTAGRLDMMTDSVGSVRIEDLPPGSYRIEIRDHGKALQFAALVHPGETTDAGTRTPVPTGSAKGRTTTPGAAVSAKGLSHWTRSDAACRFQLDSLPTGTVELVTSGGAHAFVDIPVGGTAQAGALRTDSVGQILLEDFEDGDTRHRWAPLTGNGWWYVATSAGIATTPATVSTQFWLGIDSISPERGKAFHATFNFDSAKTNPWAEAGTGVAGKSVGDLTGLASIAFWAKGSGSFAVHINSKTLGRIETGIQLSQNWKEYVVPIHAFHKGVGADSTATIRQILSSAAGLAWECTAAGDIWLDEIRLIGVSPKSVWGDISPP